MSFARPLCVLCERPAADGFVQAVNVDKEKLQNWLLIICGYEFSEEIQDKDLICNFCIWHAEFLAKHGLNFEADSWWPQHLDYLDDAAKELRKSYFDGKVEQCWVQLEKIADSQSEEEEIESDNHSKLIRTKCFYCDKSYKFSSSLANHVKSAHKNAMRCDKQNCASYFHTIEEKEEHVKNFHEKSKERKVIQCFFCEKEFQEYVNYRSHVRHIHTEYPVKCSLRGCIHYFKSEDDMKSHFDTTHKDEGEEPKAYECEYCGYRAKKKTNLEKHITAKHFPKTIKCEKCDKLFSTMELLKMHGQQDHSFKNCSICDEDVTSRNISLHLKKQKCHRCKNKFDCLGLFQTHRGKCKETRIKCDKCEKMFHIRSLLDYHVERTHRNNSWRGLQHKNLGFRCEPCKRFFKSATNLKSHLKYRHNAANLKKCAHCPKSFTRFSNLKNHLAMRHNLIESSFECDFCKKRFFLKYNLLCHIQRSHLDRAREKCEMCGKEMLLHSMKKHLYYIHGQL